MSDPIRVGVIGGGLIAQAVHLPNLARMTNLYSIAGIADPSARVRAHLERLYRPAVCYADWHAMLSRERLDGVVICSPAFTHVETVLAALDHGLHVFVEKPLCIDPADAWRIAERRRVADRVVQVAYMKRFDPAYEALLREIPVADDLRLIEAVTYDPGMAREPFVPRSTMVVGDDVPPRVIRAGRSSEQEQVCAAVGDVGHDAVRAFVDVYLGALVHDVNLIHGILEQLGVGSPASAVAADTWSQGTAARVSQPIAVDARWTSTWMHLGAINEFRETLTCYFDGAVHRLQFDAPYFVEVPTTYDRRHGRDRAAAVREPLQRRNVYVDELTHFRACILREEGCRTPPEQGARDVDVLARAFQSIL
jgi:predicted dehydrogenase